MEKIFFILFLPTLSFGQYTTIPTKDLETVYVDTVYKIDSVSKIELYLRSKIWLSSYFKSSKAVIDLDDKDNGVLIGKGNQKIVVETAIGDPFETKCHFTFKLSFKDGKVKVEIYDLYYKIDHAYYVGNILVPETETYPKTWFLPKIGKRMVKTCQGYRNETLRVINEICSTLESGLRTDYVNKDW